MTPFAAMFMYSEISNATEKTLQVTYSTYRYPFQSTLSLWILVDILQSIVAGDCPYNIASFSTPCHIQLVRKRKPGSKTTKGHSSLTMTPYFSEELLIVGKMSIGTPKNLHHTDL